MLINSMFNSSVTGSSSSLTNYINQSLGSKSSSGSLSNLSSLLSDYSSIKNGSYGKLMNAYYAKNSTSSSTSAKKTTSNDKSEETSSTSALDSLVGSSTASTSTTGTAVATTKSVDKTSTAAATKLVDSTTALDKLTYNDTNRDKISEAVDAFVNEYNNTLKAAGESKITNVRSNAEWMANGTKSNEKLLSSVGITINEDNTLSFDKEAFASANMTTVKTVFDGNDSYAHSIANRATKIYTEAALAGTAASTYTATADYASTTTGTLLDSLM